MVFIWICVIVFSFGTTVRSQNCPYGWYDRPNSDKCYFLTHSSAVNTWEDSRLKCTASGGDLVSITSRQEWDYINQTMYSIYISSQKRFQHWWIGLNRRDDDTTWKWADGSPADMSILTWRKDAAISDKTKNCVHMFLFQMDVGSCSNRVYQSICSRSKGVPIQCDADNGWQHYNGKCYKYFNTARTWTAASASCNTLGATLPTIPDLTTQTIVADFARQKKTSLWTGLKSRGQPKNIVWVWQDGSRLAGNPYWAPNQPPPNMNSRINSTCVELDPNTHLPSTWVGTQCNVGRMYYCQRPEGKCADGWLEYGTMCYQFNPHFTLPWTEASSYCQSLGGNLVAITSSRIQTFLNQYLTTENQIGVTELWIGLTDNNKDNGPWMFSSGVSTRTSNYTNWNSNSPTNQHGIQDCAYIATSDPGGKWRIAQSCTEARSFICQIKTNTQVKTVTQPPNHYICPSNWINNDKYCYYFNEEDKSYDDARSWCRGNGSDLVRISYSGIQGFLASKMNYNGDYWIGLNDRHQEGWWAWLDDTVNATYTYWYKTEPNNTYGGADNCAAMIGESNPSRKGRWHASKCSNNFNFICQMTAQNAYNTPPPVTATPWSTKCGPFWSSDPFSPFCYQFSDEKLTWFDAQTTCQSRGGDLVSIETSEESAYIMGRIRQMNSVDYWIGANDQGIEGGWKWTDGSPFGFLNWNAGEPNDFNHGEDCASIFRKNGRWHDNYCNFRKGYICKTAAYYMCDSGWKLFKHNCFNFNTGKNTWQNSRNWCKSQESDLVRIFELDVLGFIRDQVDGSGDWWTGLNDRNSTGIFVWLDDTNPSGVVQWKTGEPSSLANKKCVTILMTQGPDNDGKYNDDDCNKQNNFICMKRGQQVKSTPRAQTATPSSVPAGFEYGCPRKWHGFRGSCYRFLNNTGSYVDSIAACGRQGGHLASIIDEAENNYVFSLIPTGLAEPDKSVWLGLNDRTIEMKYVWTDGQPVTYTKWYRGEPNNWQGHDEDCVAMYTKYPYWLDKVCSDSLSGTVCKKSKAVIPKNQTENYDKGCQDKQIGFQSTCYRFYLAPSTWSDAEKSCARDKGHLATIPDSHVQADLAVMMLDKASAFWVGLSDLEKPGQYQWSSGQQFSFSAWYETHTGNERSTCVGIRSGHPAGLWENHNCTEHRSYICEYPRTSYTTLPTTPTTTPSHIPCPQSWTDFAGVCYKYFGDTPDNLKTWSEARDICQGYGGDLVSIKSFWVEMFFNNVLLANKTDLFWIGLNDRDAENSYQWSDRSPFGYSNWANNEPNNYNHKEDCVEYNALTNHWNDDYCYGTKYYMCQLRRGVQITTTPTPPAVSTSPLCIGNGTWYLYNNFCYMVSPTSGTDSLKTWYNAARYCNKQGGYLTSIHGPDENGFISAMLRTVQKEHFWIGLNNIGLSGYQWSDNTPVEYLSWNLHQPDDGLGEKRCVNIISQMGSWFDGNCNNLLRFICRKPPLNTKPMTPYPTPYKLGGCPVGFTTFFASTKCFMVGGKTPDKHLNWTDANAMCNKKAKGATLAVILGDLDNTFVVTLLKGVQSHAWIGLMDRQTNGLYMWVDSSEVRYTGWGPGQPDEDVAKDQSEHRTDCVKMWTDPRGLRQAGGWDDFYCDTKLAYVCSAPKLRHGFMAPTPNTAGCKSGYDRYDHSCYKGFRTPKTWTDAQAACVVDGDGRGNLASLNDAFEAAFVDLTMIHEKQGPSWIGLSDLNNEGNFTWSDGYPMLYSNWGQGQPAVLPGGGCIYEKWNFKWNITNCNDTKPYLCEIHVAGGPTAPPPINGSCPDNTWTAGPIYCYKAEGSTPKSWPEARYMCQGMGGDLASIGSPAEMTIITNMMINNHTDIWIGLSKTTENGYRWSDRGTVSYVNWALNEPSDSHSYWHQDCVVMMSASSWQWNDIDCLQPNGYICKILKRTAGGSTSTQNPSTTQKHPNTPSNPINTPSTPINTQKPSTPFSPLGTPYHPSFTHQGTSGPENTQLPQVKQPVNPGGGLSGGTIAGIVIGVMAVFVVVSVAVFIAKKKFSAGPGSPSSGFLNALYSRTTEKVSVSPRGEGSTLYLDEEQDEC